MGRSLAKKLKSASANLSRVDLEAAIKARDYFLREKMNVETFRDYCANAGFPVQSVFFGKAASGDYTAALRLVRYIFPDAEWVIDNEGAEINVRGEEFSVDWEGAPFKAMVHCVLDAIIFFRSHE